MSDEADVLSAIEVTAAHMRNAYKLAPPVLPEAVLPDRWADRMVEVYGSLGGAGDAIGAVLRRYSDVYGTAGEEVDGGLG